MSTPTPSRLANVNLSLGLLLLAALMVRLLVLGFHGHGGDIGFGVSWAERLAQVGPWHFYNGDAYSVYPALLYLHWPLGLLLDGDQLWWTVKGLSIVFDLAIGVVLFRLGQRFGSPLIGLVCAALFLFNPAVLLAGPIWGQIDAAGTLVILLCLVATADRRFALAGALAILAGLTKPQFGIVLLPVLVVALMEGGSLRWRTTGRVLIGGLAMALLVMVPLRLTPFHYLDEIGLSVAAKTVTSANAFNPWALLVGLRRPDGLLVVPGALLLLAGMAVSLLPLRRRRDLASLLTVGVFLGFAFYFLPTRVHERYLFPVTALLVPLVYAAGSARHRARLIGYVTLSLAFAAGLVYALLDTTRFTLPQPIPDLWLSTPAIWLIGLTLMGSAGWWTAELWGTSKSAGTHIE